MRTPSLILEQQPAGGGDSLVIRLIGKLSFENAPRFITTILPEPAAHLVLDMSGLSFLDSTGVGALAALFVSRRTKGKTLALASLTVQGAAVLQVTGLLKILPVYPSVEQALVPPA
ncbi:MAG TPA: STAS domain-containing protein [Candidatus Acidoferrum sp.]|jgi:anti-sigma B factor antagonist|nr:STAS domain-containing protein [Candidatus Acidoferrum sp.]